MKTLAITAFLLIAAVGGGIGWLYMNPGPGIEPSAVVNFDGREDAAPPSGAAPPAVDQPALPGEEGAADSNFQLPPGVSVFGLEPPSQQAAPQPPAQSPPAQEAPQPQPEQAPQPEPPAAEAPDVDWQTEVNPPGAEPQSAPGAEPALPGVQEAGLVGGGADGLATAPVKALVETSAYGPLPKVAPDGKKPADVYARPAPADPAAEKIVGRIAILVVGLGLSEATTQEAIDKLPDTISLAFGPYGRNVQDWAARARSGGHEILLQIPLEPYDYPDNDPGPHTLLTSLSEDENLQRLHWLMTRFTGYVGLTNNMGAKFAAAQAAFLPVLEEARTRGLIYLDDGTGARSAATQIASDSGLLYQTAQVRIDAVPDAVEIRKALGRLEVLARERGAAVGVASSLPLTIAEIRQWADGLAARDIALIPVSAVARHRQQT